MICFEIFVNGERLCLAGVESGVLAADLLCYQEPLEEDSTTERESQLTMRVSGHNNGETYHWTESAQTLSGVGDEITIRVVEADTPDEGVRYYPKSKQ